MRSSIKRALAVAGAAVMLAAGIGTSAIASSGSDPQVPGKAANVKGAPGFKDSTCEYPVNAPSIAGAGNPVQNKIVTTSDASWYTNSAAWMNVECGATRITVPRGKYAGINVTVDAEVNCLAAAANTNWCEGRVLIGGVPGFPREPDATGSFAWAQSTTDAGAWESATFQRSYTVYCPTSSATVYCTYAIQLQAKNNAAGLSMRIDGSTVNAFATFH